MKKAVLTIIVLVIVVVGLWLVWGQQAVAPTNQSPTASTSIAISNEFGGGVKLGQ